MKDSLVQSEKLRKNKSHGHIPFKRIDELQELKSENAKLEIMISELEKTNALVTSEKDQTSSEFNKLKEDYETLNEL